MAFTPERLIQELKLSADDPMWADHVEMPKSLLRIAISVLEAESPWVETAKQHLRNEEYYRGLLDQIGAHLGKAAYVQDDGNISDEILRAKLPELVAEIAEKAWRYDE